MVIYVYKNIHVLKIINNENNWDAEIIFVNTMSRKQKKFMENKELYKLKQNLSVNQGVSTEGTRKSH